MRIAARIFAIGFVLSVSLRADGPVKLDFPCTPEDMDRFGLSCAPERPCEVLLELTSADSGAGRLIVAGNLHTASETLYGLVLSSEDNGLTWTEANPRIPSASLDMVRFFDVQTGWISGEAIDPLARDPFFLLTTDGGKTWRKRPVSDETIYGVISQFQFDSPSHGEMVVDSSQGRTTRQSLYETMTGGESWELKQSSNMPIKLQPLKSQASTALRVRADAKSGTYVVERGAGKNWDAIASFQIKIAACE